MAGIFENIESGLGILVGGVASAFNAREDRRAAEATARIAAQGTTAALAIKRDQIMMLAIAGVAAATIIFLIVRRRRG